MIYLNEDPAVHGAGARFLAHVSALNHGAPGCPGLWAWLYPPGHREDIEALRCGYSWDESPRGPLVVVEWRPGEDPARQPRPLLRRVDRAVVWAWPDRVQMVVMGVPAWAPPAHVEAYLRRIVAIAEGTGGGA